MPSSNSRSNDRLTNPRKSTTSLISLTEAESSKTPGLDVTHRGTSPPPKKQSPSYTLLKNPVAQFQSRPPPPTLPTLEQITADASTATESEIYQAIGLCARQICDAARSHLPKGGVDRMCEEEELAGTLLQRWNSCETRNDKFLASVPREALVEMFRDALGEMSALEKRVAPSAKKGSKASELKKGWSRRFSWKRRRSDV